jgi:hypothetical protein
VGQSFKELELPKITFGIQVDNERTCAIVKPRNQSFQMNWGMIR